MSCRWNLWSAGMYVIAIAVRLLVPEGADGDKRVSVDVSVAACLAT